MNVQAQLYWYIIRQNLDKDPYFKDFKLADYRFIVICNRTRTPLVWEWSHTKTDVDFVLGDTKFENWRGIVKRLHKYLTDSPKVPEGIKDTGINDIAQFIIENSIPNHGSN